MQYRNEMSSTLRWRMRCTGTQTHYTTLHMNWLHPLKFDGESVQLARLVCHPHNLPINTQHTLRVFKGYTDGVPLVYSTQHAQNRMSSLGQSGVKWYKGKTEHTLKWFSQCEEYTEQVHIAGHVGLTFSEYMHAKLWVNSTPSQTYSAIIIIE